MNEFNDIFNKLQLFEKMYQSMRIVDPIKKRVIESVGNRLYEIDDPCYEYWEKQIACENCASIRAYNENDTIYKMECKGNAIYMVTAVPVSVNEKVLIVELLKNATNSLYMENEEPGDGKIRLSKIEHMNRAAVMDELTHLYNRRYINERLPTDLLTSSINNEPLSIIFADLDFFKNINDTYGHTAGDQVLRKFAQELKKHIRDGKDWAARYGGEEFLICLPNTDVDTAKDVAERIRKSVMEKEFIVGSNRIRLTCSFGVHTAYNWNECVTTDSIIELADKKLYQAKSSGRNKVVHNSMEVS